MRGTVCSCGRSWSVTRGSPYEIRWCGTCDGEEEITYIHSLAIRLSLLAPSWREDASMLEALAHDLPTKFEAYGHARARLTITASMSLRVLQRFQEDYACLVGWYDYFESRDTADDAIW